MVIDLKCERIEVKGYFNVRRVEERLNELLSILLVIIERRNLHFPVNI